MSSNHEDSQRPIIIIKKIKKVVNKHHGGSWKIAYADFVTAMMAFFLMMWLLSLLNKYQLEGISRYFKKPLKEVFTKQDNIARTNTIKPDKLGPSTEKNTGAITKTENAVDKNLGLQTKPQKDMKNTYGLSQTAISPDTNTEEQKPTQHLKDKDKDKDQDRNKLLQEEKTAEQMKAELEAKLNSDPEISQFKNQINFVVTADGLKIVINDLQNKPMFSQGKTDFQQYAANILNWLSKQVNAYNNKIEIIGHTDSVPYSGETNYTNWELSADRANATRRVLINAGMDENRVIRVIGGADTVPLEPKAGKDPSNRRIEIIVLTDEAIKHIQNE